MSGARIDIIMYLQYEPELQSLSLKQRWPLQLKKLNCLSASASFAAAIAPTAISQRKRRKFLENSVAGSDETV